jgi:hypothetical protein
MEFMMETITYIMSVLQKDETLGFLSISMGVNVYLFLLYLRTNEKYINTLVDNIKITEKINAIMGKLKINSENQSDSTKKEIGQ